MKTMITNKNIDIELFRQLKGIDFEYLVQLSALIAENIENNGADCLEEEMQVFDTTLDNVIKERIYELCNSEKQVKELLSEDVSNDHENELDIKFSDEAEKLVKELVQNFNGRTIEFDVLRASDRITKQILDLKSFKNSIEVIETAQRCVKNGTIDMKTADRLIFINYLAIWNVLNLIREKDWTDIENFEILHEEDIEVKEYLLDYIKCNQENGLETDADTVEFLCSCGFDEVYVRTLKDEDDCVCIVLFDNNENRLSDCYYLN